MKKDHIIAIDGPSGSGKSTVSKKLAERLGYIYIDTGAMYRAVALHAERGSVDIEDDHQLARMLEGLDIRFKRSEKGLRTLLLGEDVSEHIRTPKMSMAASRISALALVRDKMLELQRGMGEQGGIVMEGRDIGTVVFPDADYKFFLTANAELRARRRFEELSERGEEVDFASTLREIIKRDREDSNRAIAPLRPAEDAVSIDTSNLGIDQVVERLLDCIGSENTGNNIGGY